MYTFYPYFTDYGVTYEWAYDGTTRGETLRYQFNSADQSCAMVIIDDQNVQTECSCRLTTCSGLDPSFSYAQIDCTNYESGAVANECLPNMGVETGSVLEGLAVTWSGMCVSGGDVESPMATPAPSDGGDGGSSPTHTPSSAETIPVTTPPPSPAPSKADIGLAPTQPPTSAETVPISTPPPSPPPSAVEIRPTPTQATSGENVVPTRAPSGGADGDANPAPAPSGGDGADLVPTFEPFPSLSPGDGTDGIDSATTSKGSCTFSKVGIVALACSAVGAWVGAIVDLA